MSGAAFWVGGCRFVAPGVSSEVVLQESTKLLLLLWLLLLCTYLAEGDRITKHLGGFLTTFGGSSQGCREHCADNLVVQNTINGD